MRREYEQKLRRMRFEDRNNVEELISPILSLDLVEQFHGKSPDDLAQELPTVPNMFNSVEEYLEIWIPLFLYETYNQLIQKKSKEAKLDR